MGDQTTRQTERDPNIRGIVFTSVIIVIIIVGLVFAVFHYFGDTLEGISSDQALKTTVSELPAMRRAEDSVLNSYGVINAAAGTYRIPIEQAMRLMAVDSSGATPVK
jgi:hypothetical protein